MTAKPVSHMSVPTTPELQLHDLVRYMTGIKKIRFSTQERLVFLGVSNIAHYGWCDVQSILRSVDRELEFFVAYFIDYLEYSKELGHLRELPQRITNRILRTVEPLPLENMETLLKRRHPRKDGNWLEVITRNEATAQGIIDTTWGTQFTTLPQALVNGLRAEELYAEKHPTIRWSFGWKDYMITGIPDGITDDFVYEFKSTRTHYLSKFIEPVARNQADLYGFLFKRAKKRIQIRIADTGETITIDEPTDGKRALGVLHRFDSLYHQETSALRTKVSWKCQKCEYQDRCQDFDARRTE